MVHPKICDECWVAFTTEYSNVKLCWDCQRLAIIKEHPEVALRNESLMRLAFDNGLKIERTPDGVKVTNIFAYEDEDEQWQEDLNKIVIRRKQKYGKRPPFERAWHLAAIAARKRAGAKFPSNRLKLIAQKRTETTEDGEVIKRTETRDIKEKSDSTDETDGGSSHRAHLVQHAH